MKSDRKLARCIRAVNAASLHRVQGGTLAQQYPRRWRSVLAGALRLAPEYPPSAWAFAFEGVGGSLARCRKLSPELVADLATMFVRFTPGPLSRKARRRAAELASKAETATRAVIGLAA